MICYRRISISQKVLSFWGITPYKTTKTDPTARACNTKPENRVRNVVHLCLSLCQRKVVQSEKNCSLQQDDPSLTVQSTLGLETLDKAAALGLETATPLTGPPSVHK